MFTHIIPRCEHWDSRFTNHVYNRHVIGQKVCDPDESLLKGKRQYPCLNEIYLNRSVSIYHAFLSLIVNNHAENVVRASCNARVKIRVSFVTSTRTVSNERKKEEGGEEKGGETLTTTRPRSWLEWHFRESALPVEFYFFPPLSLFFPPVFSMLPYFVQEVSKGQATPIVP